MAEHARLEDAYRRSPQVLTTGVCHGPLTKRCTKLLESGWWYLLRSSRALAREFSSGYSCSKLQKEVGQALQMFNSRLPGAGSGPALSARLTPEEVSSKVTPDPPQLVRDAVKV